MLKCKVIKGDDISHKKADFVELYNNSPKTVNEIMEILNLSLSQYRSMRKECMNENLLNVRGNNKKKPKPEPEYITRGRSGFCERFYVVKKREYYAGFRNKRDAKKMVEMLKQCNWDKSKVPMIKEQICGSNNKRND